MNSNLTHIGDFICINLKMANVHVGMMVNIWLKNNNNNNNETLPWTGSCIWYIYVIMCHPEFMGEGLQDL